MIPNQPANKPEPPGKRSDNEQVRIDLVTYPAQPHSLPFRTILGEYHVRRSHDLGVAIAKALPPEEEQGPAPLQPNDPSPKDLRLQGEKQWARIQSVIENSERAYRVLSDKKEALQAIRKRQGSEFYSQISRQYQEVLDAEKKCKEADTPLIAILHAMQGTALCLSGGGIRSASFSLGVLEGLARLSRRNRPKEKQSVEQEQGPHVKGQRKHGHLEDKSILGKLDYLSTVSGGGYIGSWFMAWATRAGYSNVVDALARPAETSGDPEPQPIRHLREYTSYLTPHYGFTLDTFTLLAIVLRNMLLNWTIIVPTLIALLCIPELLYEASLGATLRTSSDPVLHVALWVGSICVGFAAFFAAWSIVNPSYASEVVNPGKIGSTMREVWFFVLPLLVGGWFLAAGWSWANQPANRAVAGISSQDSLLDIAKTVAWFALMPPVVMAVIRLHRLWPRVGSNNPSPLRRIVRPFTEAGQETTGKHEESQADATQGRSWLSRQIAIVNWLNVLRAVFAPIFTGCLAAFLLAVLAKYLPMPVAGQGQTTYVVLREYMWLCIPVIWSALLVASTFLSGLLSGIETEEEREWWARAGGLLLSFQLGWIALLGVAFYGGYALRAISAGILAAVGIGSGYVGSLAGLSSATTSGLKKVKLDQLTKKQQWLSRHDMVAPVACAIALICLLLSLAALTSRLRQEVFLQLRSTTPAVSVPGETPLPSPAGAAADARIQWANGIGTLVPEGASGHSRPPTPLSSAVCSAFSWLHIGTGFFGITTRDHAGDVARLETGLTANLLVLLTFAGIALLANLFIDVNIFSLHGMYRMRLTRAYLGASNFARHPDNFTNFDWSDNIYESRVVVHHNAPLHIINTALNVVATSNLAWQQRKAESFTFSPISVGSWRLGYLPTAMYGGSAGVRLGTALAISGAAFNPNMGYNSSPLVTLLMTFFNARLGWWLPNPLWPALQAKAAKDQSSSPPDLRLSSLLKSWIVSYYLHRKGPTWALPPLINEALGNTDDSYKWIELTDGGHFENLGLYEMVLRRCKWIVLVDGDADPDFEFEDLGNAIRKIQIDLGIPIVFPKYPSGLPMKRGTHEANSYYALGEILYDCVDNCGSQLNGRLLYIKPSLSGVEPTDIRAYASAHATFPHEATVNQFFNEAQFESYRHLGSWEMAAIAGEFADDHGGPTTGASMEELFKRVDDLKSSAENKNPKRRNLMRPFNWSRRRSD